MLLLLLAACAPEADITIVGTTPGPATLPDNPDHPEPPPPAEAPVPACDLGLHALSYTIELEHAGRIRTALVDLPPDYDGTSLHPVVLNFHGALSTAADQRAYTGMPEAAGDRGWIAVHPDGWLRTWDSGSESEDIGFVDAVLHELITTVCVDESRVYSTGLSNGGFFSYQLACDRADRIAAIAPVAGTDDTRDCVPAADVPLLHTHGTDDLIVPYDDSWLSPGARTSVEGWAEDRLKCFTAPVVTWQQGDVTCETWSCEPATEATLCTVDGGGHTWPGAPPLPLLGTTSVDLDATAFILHFFELSPRDP